MPSVVCGDQSACLREPTLELQPHQHKVWKGRRWVSPLETSWTWSPAPSEVSCRGSSEMTRVGGQWAGDQPCGCLCRKAFVVGLAGAAVCRARLGSRESPAEHRGQARAAGRLLVPWHVALLVSTGLDELLAGGCRNLVFWASQRPSRQLLQGRREVREMTALAQLLQPWLAG